MASALAAKMKAQGLNKLRDTMARIMRGEIGMRLYVWASTMRKEARERDGAQKAVNMAAELAKKSRSQGIRKLGVAFARIARGEVGMRVYVWQSKVKTAVRAKLADDAGELEAMMKRKSKNQAIGKLRVAFARIARGEVGMRVFVWSMRTREAKEARMASALAAKMKAQGLNKLRDTMARIMRGEIGMRLHIWGAQLSADRQASAAAAAAAEMGLRLAQLRSQGLGKLRVAMARVARGELGMRLHVWDVRMKAAKAADVARTVPPC